MRYAWILFLFLSMAQGNDFTWSFLKSPVEKLSKNILTALFDGEEPFNGGRVIWDGASARDGCGILILFRKPTAISKLIVTTAKPNPLPFLPKKTEFRSWDDARQLWSAPVIIPDITARADDRKFTAPRVQTVWIPSGSDADETRAVKILMYGSGIWMTELQICDKSGRRLTPEKGVVRGNNMVTLKPSAHAGGASANIGIYHAENRYVGNPNALNRKDRVLFQFDLRECLERGKITQGILTLALSPMGYLNADFLQLEVFSSERVSLRSMDLIATDTVPCREILFDRKSPLYHSFDVTEFLNHVLAGGDGSVTFRLRNGTVEKVGNRYSKPEGVLLDYGRTKLEIVK